MVQIDNDYLHQLLEEAKVTRVVSNELGKQFLQIATNLIGKDKYVGYDAYIRSELMYNAMIPICKYCYNYNASKAKGKTPAFSYCTRIIEMNFWGTLGKYYKAKNFKAMLDEVVSEWVIDNADSEADEIKEMLAEVANID